MPFELGLSVAFEKTAKSQTRGWFVCESQSYRLAKSLSDLNGTDPFIHDGTIEGVFRELGNNLPVVLRQAGSGTPYTARVFRDLSVIASAAAVEVVL
jgi:hypothetical protein